MIEIECLLRENIKWLREKTKRIIVIFELKD